MEGGEQDARSLRVSLRSADTTVAQATEATPRTCGDPQGQQGSPESLV